MRLRRPRRSQALRSAPPAEAKSRRMSSSGKQLLERLPIHECLVTAKLIAAHLDDVHAAHGDLLVAADAPDVHFPETHLAVHAGEPAVFEHSELHFPESEEAREVSTQLVLAANVPLH